MKMVMKLITQMTNNKPQTIKSMVITNNLMIPNNKMMIQAKKMTLINNKNNHLMIPTNLLIQIKIKKT
jgi:hypothetical protein